MSSLQPPGLWHIGRMPMRRKAAILLLLMPIATARADGLLDRVANRAPAVAAEDDGGSVLERAAFIKSHRDDFFFRLPLECYSSCTLLLAIRGACVAPGSHLYFHSATLGGRRSPRWNAYAMGFYPPPVRRWVVAHRALGSLRFTALDWRTAANLGVRVCD
ncbi:MAG: hypothetical protein WAN31_02035 [Methylovirgula sp.]|jgi:hypothetical protein